MILKTEAHSQEELIVYLKSLQKVTDVEAETAAWKLSIVLNDIDRQRPEENLIVCTDCRIPKSEHEMHNRRPYGICDQCWFSDEKEDIGQE